LAEHDIITMDVTVNVQRLSVLSLLFHTERVMYIYNGNCSVGVMFKLYVGVMFKLYVGVMFKLSQFLGHSNESK
jgi:hypothetical protein